MRLSDLLESEVFDADGNGLGHVRDVLLVADGPKRGDFGPALRVHGVLVGRGSVGARLGLARDRMKGPWLLKLLFGRRPRHLVEWSRVASVEDRRIRLRPG
jgi:sporulation protein YlmC with PRC-barrel domain